MNTSSTLALAFLTVLPTHAFASSQSAGPNGIDAVGLGLDGGGIIVGQVEQSRVGDPDLDMDQNHNDSVRPQFIGVQDDPGDPPADLHIGPGHATRVASVMISTDSTDDDMDGITPLGFSRGISLHSRAAAVGAVAGQDDSIKTTQFIVRDADIPIVNHSWGNIVGTGETTDGNSNLTLGLDWLAHRDDVLN